MWEKIKTALWGIIRYIELLGVICVGAYVIYTIFEWIVKLIN